MELISWRLQVPWLPCSSQRAVNERPLTSSALHSRSSCARFEGLNPRAVCGNYRIAFSEGGELPGSGRKELKGQLPLPKGDCGRPFLPAPPLAMLGQHVFDAGFLWPYHLASAIWVGREGCVCVLLMAVCANKRAALLQGTIVLGIEPPQA